jgi:hypothetical protein
LLPSESFGFASAKQSIPRLISRSPITAPQFSSCPAVECRLAYLDEMVVRIIPATPMPLRVAIRVRRDRWPLFGGYPMFND